VGMVASGRVGQVTFAVSERTSCKNLNGLKAIVFVIHVLRRSTFCGIRTDLSRPALFLRMSRQAGSIVGEIQSRAGYPSKRAGSRWRLCTAGGTKGQGAPEPACPASVQVRPT